MTHKRSYVSALQYSKKKKRRSKTRTPAGLLSGNKLRTNRLKPPADRLYRSLFSLAPLFFPISESSSRLPPIPRRQCECVHVCVSVCVLSEYLSVCLCRFVSMSVCLFVHLSICPSVSVCLSVSLPFSLSLTAGIENIVVVEHVLDSTGRPDQDTSPALPKRRQALLHASSPDQQEGLSLVQCLGKLRHHSENLVRELPAFDTGLNSRLPYFICLRYLFPSHVLSRKKPLIVGYRNRMCNENR